MMKFKEVLKRKFLEGPGSNQSSLEALNRSVVNIEQAKLQNKKYEEERRNYKASISPPVGNPTIWGPELQAFIEQGTFCPLTALRKPNVDLDSHAARGEYMKAKLNLVQHKLGAFPPALLTEVPQCQLDMQVARDVPDDRAVPMETDKLVPGSPEAKVAMLYNMLNMSDGQIRVHAGRWTKYESMEEPTWAKEKQPSWDDALAMERRTHPSDQGGHFLEFHTYTEEEIEDHRRLGLRPLWRDLKGHFFAWEPAPASGGAGTCWVKEVQTWTLPTLLGVYGHQFSLKQKRHGRGQRGGGAEGARERVLERKKIQQETNDFLEVMNIPKPTTQEEWRAVWKEVGTLLAAKHFITHTPVPVMDLPIATVVDSKERLRFRAMCDERISFPFEELREFPDVYSKLEPYVAADSFVEVKVAWRCNTEQWWWAEVHPSQAGPLYKKLGYSDAAIRAFGLDPEGPVGTPYLPAAASGADQGSQPPLLMEYPDQPRPPITVENVKSVLGTKAKKGLQAQNKHLFWAKTECGVQAREAIDAFIMGLVRFQVGCCARFNDMQHTSPGTLKVTTSTIEMMAWQTKTASAFKIKKNPVPLIAPKLSLSGVDWWTDWVETLKTLFALERFQDMDYLIPTLSKDFQGVIPRPGSSDRSLRWLIRHGVPQELVQPLSWHSFRVFIPDCAYQLGIPRTQRQYLGNWQTESTADIYTREKRNVVVDIWGKVLSRLRDINLDPGKEVREDLSHEDWDDKHGPSDHGSPVKSGSFHLVSEDETTEQQSDGLGSGKSKPSARTARSVEPPHEDLPRRNMFQVVPSDEVLPPVGPLIVVASLRKTGNPPKRKLHLLDREGRAVGCGWSPDLSKISSMGKEDYENEVGELVQCSRCFLRFTLPNEWLFDVSQDPAVALDSDSSVSFGSLTDSSVDTASDCDKVTLPSLERDGALLPLQ